jgi:hypothetical protein
MTKRDVERQALIQEQLDAISNKIFVSERLTQVRDIFLFCCYTGLAYADFQKLRRSEIVTGIEIKEKINQINDIWLGQF